MTYLNVKDSAPIATLQDGIRKIYNFLPGNDGRDNNILYVDYWDGSEWLSADQGLGSTSAILSHHPAAIAYQEGGGKKFMSSSIGTITTFGPTGGMVRDGNGPTKEPQDHE